MGVRKVLLILSEHDQAFDGLRQQKLMMEGNISSSVLKRKDNSYSQETIQLRGKKCVQDPAFKKLRKAKVLQIRLINRKSLGKV